MNKIIIAFVLVVCIGVGAYVFMRSSSEVVIQKENTPVTPVTEKEATSSPQSEEQKQEEQKNEEKNKKETVIGSSFDEHNITAHHYGTGEKELLFVGGIHGGYSWNTTLLAYNLMDYLEKTPDAVPEGVKVTVIPVLNPDGLNKVAKTTGRFTEADIPKAEAETIPGRFNGNNVDLNRNFDCDWKPNGTWQSRAVSGGGKAFSEPESQAFQKYVNEHKPTAVVVWYSSAGGVYASNCHNGVLPETEKITNLYAKASGYPAHNSFDFYELTGDMVNWLAKNEIPAISVLLTTHRDIEWNKNRAGIEALMEHYAE